MRLQTMSDREMEMLERVARHLVQERRSADMAINPQCMPYPTWEEASEEYRDGARRRAADILGLV